ncbi:hypothetical protein AC579_9107 [Pseudocercospora musae]|uniref:Uncharacterized protein n=1 Tax=Pseudocercospora musae TaxID=113226 RepID=A0A139IIG0_9PEZI|nr:hypothetical protein AC579_9107 [Pseudocercospora musae]
MASGKCLTHLAIPSAMGLLAQPPCGCLGQATRFEPSPINFLNRGSIENDDGVPAIADGSNTKPMTELVVP